MRRKMVLGVGLAGILGGSAVGQFGGNPPVPGPPNPAPSGFAAGQPVGRPLPGAPVPGTPQNTMPLAGGFQPAGGAVPPVGGLQPAGGAIPGAAVNPAALPPLPAVEIPRALDPSHPLALRPEHGNYFISVKSYSRPARPDPNDPGRTALQLAEALAAEIKAKHGVNVYLFEHISEEKKAQAAARAQALQRAAAFQASMDAYRQKSQLRGMEFLDPDQKIHYQTFNYRDQVAVLVGGFATEQEALKLLAKMKNPKEWPPPRDETLMDGGAIAGVGPDGKPMIEKGRLNPFPQAMVVPNPTVPRAAAAAPTGLDPFVVKLNEGNPYSLLKATKGWTLGVKSFSAPVLIQQYKDGDSSMMRKLMGKSSGADALAAGAEQAEMLARALRDARMKPCPFEAFVLHTRTGSIVTVGQFDGPTDPALLETRRILAGMKFNTSKDERGTAVTAMGQQLFGDNIVPIPVPRPER
jgi:hypothetical protein